MKINGQLHDCTDALLGTIKPYIVQLFKVDNRVQPVTLLPHASGVLFAHNDGYYLITAGHVYENEAVCNIGVCCDGAFYILNGEVLFTPTKFSDENDRGDIAVCKLNNDVAMDLIEHYSFLDMGKIAMGHIMAKYCKYFIYGYPAGNRSKYLHNHKTHSFSYDTQGGRTNGYNYLIPFHRRKLQAPKVAGISGTGLWYISHNDIYLIGIMTENKDEYQEMQATCIDLPLSVIKQYWDNTIPESKIIRPNFT
jgi:hypothetical protein